MTYDNNQRAQMIADAAVRNEGCFFEGGIVVKLDPDRPGYVSVVFATLNGAATMLLSKPTAETLAHRLAEAAKDLT